MGLFSDLDWLIIVGVAAFLLFGEGNRQALRTLGRWYGRANRLKQELLSEFSKAADLPVGGGAPNLSLRSVLLGVDPPSGQESGIPAAVARAAPSLAVAAPAPAAVPWTGSPPVPTWSTTAHSSYVTTGGFR